MFALLFVFLVVSLLFLIVVTIIFIEFLSPDRADRPLCLKAVDIVSYVVPTRDAVAARRHRCQCRVTGLRPRQGTCGRGRGWRSGHGAMPPPLSVSVVQ
jgi:hypothetical protein